LALKMMQEGIGSLTLNDKILIEFLAKSCPYEQGKAVFKARSIWALFAPATQYNDRLQCMPQVQNRSSNGTTNSSNNIDSLLETQVNDDAIKLYEYTNFMSEKDSAQKLIDLIEVYPNPATNYLFVNSPINEKGIFELQTILGQVILKAQIEESISTIKLPLLSNGTYNYKIIFKNNIYYGKITIKKE